MRISKTKFIFFLIFYILLAFAGQIAYAKETDSKQPAVSVINEIRGPQLGLEDQDLLESLKGQWDVTKEAGVLATWLWQYSALEYSGLVNFAKEEMGDQEFGIFLEIDRNFADKTGVRYRGDGAWYFSDGLFLVSYEQHDRRKLIDTVFEKFKDDFGYYPKTVGAWWVGAESIKYMQEKYDVIAVLQCADQFNTDKYSIWGTPWSIPYLPSSRNAAIPANNYSDRIPNVVMLQWATRDPVAGYGDSVFDSTYSIQDYAMKKYKSDEYLSYFKNIYLKEPLDHMVVGLEGGFGPGTYQTTYRDNLLEFKNMEKEGFIKLQTAGEYASEFLESERIIAPTNYFLTKDFASNDQAFWYNSPSYRILIQKQGDNIYLSDLRDYLNTPGEEFYKLPNTQDLLRINTKSIVDSVRFPEQKIKLRSSDKPLELLENKRSKTLKNEGEIVAVFTDDSVSLPTINKSWNFDPLIESSIGLNYDVFAVSILLAYAIFLYVKMPKKLLSYINIAALIFGIILLYPIYTSGQFFTDTAEFTPISLSIFDFMSLSFLSPGLKLFTYFQLIPLTFIVLMHYFLLIRPKNNHLTFLLFIALFAAIFLYMDNFYPRLLMNFDQGKKAILLTILSILGVLVFLFFSLYLHRKNRDKILGGLLVFLSLLFVWFNQNKIFAHKNYIITTFELEMLNKVYDLKEDTHYPMPAFKAENYHNTFPLLAIDKLYAEKITSVDWKTLPYMDQPYSSTDDDEILVISRYIGVEVEENNLLKKVLDNGQIAVYIPSD